MKIKKKSNSMKLTDTNIREKNFHNKLQSSAGGRLENIFYKALFNLKKDFFIYLEKNTKNKVVLDYGCGAGVVTEKMINQKPSRIIGIDISDISINKAIQSAKKLNLDIEYKVDNCENSKLGSNTFDIIYGSGILHHLNIKNSVQEINRLLKKNGIMIFIEPLGTNPIINLYRKLTPGSRSVDEHPFVSKDFNLLKKIYGEVNIKFYGFLTLFFSPFYSNPEKSKIFIFLSKIDQLIFKSNFFRNFAWSVLIICKKIK